MITTLPDTWHEANQRYLTASLADVRGTLERHVARAQDAPEKEERDEPARELQESTNAMTAPPALETLCMAFGLSPFERHLLLYVRRYGAGLDLRHALRHSSGRSPTRLPHLRPGASGIARCALERPDSRCAPAILAAGRGGDWRHADDQPAAHRRARVALSRRGAASG